jgi:hypothetical protein
MPKKAVQKQPEPEWSYLISIDDIPQTGKSLTAMPSDAEKKDIADRLGVVCVENISASFDLSRESGHVVRVKGRFSADITQTCVVSLEPVVSHIEDEFEAWYADHSQVIPFARAQHEALSKKEVIDLPMLEEEEDPEPIADGKIDLGELAVQYLSLAVNPYPHKDGINYEKAIKKEDAAGEKGSGPLLSVNPFAALKNWRPND